MRFTGDDELVFAGEAGAFVDGSALRRRDGVRACLRDVLSAFGGFDLHAEELRDSEDYVIATVNEQGVGRTGGVVVNRRHYAVWTLKGGKIVRLRVYLDRNEALRVVGLVE